MSKDKKLQGAVREENRTDAKRGERFACKTPDCRNSGYAEQMYNTSCDPMRTTPEKLLELVRCRTCAEAIASEKGKRLREAGCGVYPLLRTLKMIEESKAVRDRREDMLKWVEGLKAARKADHDQEQHQRQEEEARAEKRERVKSYANAYAESEFCGLRTVALPAARVEDGRHHCGLPIACCRHDRPAERFISVMGDVVGICRLAAAIFTEVFQEHDGRNDQRYRKLLSTGDLKQAEKFAAKWLGEEARDDEE